VHPLAHDVPHHEPDSIVGELDGVEPVASHVDVLHTREVARRDLDTGHARERHRQHAALENLRDRALRLEVARTVERLRALARDRAKKHVIVVVESDGIRPLELEDTDAPPARDEWDRDPRSLAV
jgi:hypothetical protein